MPITVSEITKRLNDIANLDVCRKLSYTSIVSRLVEIGMLEIRLSADGKNVKRPTQQGKELGISLVKRTGRTGDYVAVVYNREAQQFIIDNIEAFVPQENDEDKKGL